MALDDVGPKLIYCSQLVICGVLLPPISIIIFLATFGLNVSILAMQEIFEEVKSPGWWFTALFVAIIAGVAAAYLKDYISISLAKSSIHYRAKRREKLKQYAKTIRNMQKDGIWLVYSAIRYNILISAVFFCLVIYNINISQIFKPEWLAIIVRLTLLAYLLLMCSRLKIATKVLLKGVAQYRRRHKLYKSSRLF